jgi:hypothetical protein
MVWGKTSDEMEHRRRSLTDAQAGGAPRPVNAKAWLRSLGQTGRLAEKQGRTGSLGGAVIWVMKEAWMPARHSHAYKHAAGTADALTASDPDGFAVFGRFPKGWLRHILKLQLLGPVGRHQILHVCSGTLSATESWTVDVRPQARPRVVADGCALPFRDASFPAVLLDPPYSDQYARNLYGVENPRPSRLLREAARVVQPGGRIGLLHVAIPFAPPGCRLVKIYGVTMGVGFRIRAFTVYEREAAQLL